MKPGRPVFAIACCLLAGTAVLSALAERRVPEPLAVPLTRLPAGIDGWKATGERRLDASEIAVLRPSTYLIRTYARAGTALELFVAYFEEQRTGESMHSPRNCLPGSGWEFSASGSTQVTENRHSFTVNRYIIEKDGAKTLMLYWYQSKQRIVASEYMAKLLLARDTALSGRTSGAIVRITIPDTGNADAEAGAFAAMIVPELRHCMTGN